MTEYIHIVIIFMRSPAFIIYLQLHTIPLFRTAGKKKPPAGTGGLRENSAVRVFKKDSATSLCPQPEAAQQKYA
jgi:hypothetical protein